MAGEDKKATSEIQDLESALTTLKNVENIKGYATSNNVDSIQHILDILYQLIHAMFAGKLPNSVYQLMKEAMMTKEAFIAKVQFAYVYYYARYWELKLYGPSPKSFGNISADPNKTADKINKELSDAIDSKYYQLLDYILYQNAASKETYRFDAGTAKMAAHFPKSVFDLKKKILNRDKEDAESMTADTFFKDFKTTKGITYSSVAEKLAKLMEGKDPIDAFISLLISKIVSTKNLLKLGVKFPKSDFTKEGADLNVYYERAKEVDAIFANDLVKLFEDGDVNSEEGLEEIFKTMRQHQQDYYTKKNSEAKDKDKDQKDEKGSEKKEATGSLQDQLALNMADYITGRITADEFQKRDRLIRKNGETDQPAQQLDEEEPEEA